MINNRILQQIQLLIIHAVLLSTLQFHSTGRHYVKNFHTWVKGFTSYNDNVLHFVNKYSSSFGIPTLFA